jgi:uracil-DNA glycosylase family 4
MAKLRIMPARKPQRDSLRSIEAEIPKCRQCPELREYCAEVARTRRRAYADETYWGRPVPGFGDPQARIWIVGLAPAAHGANRTGRMFTGDRSGDFLYAGLHRAALASQAEAAHRGDGLALRGVYISAAARCAPPQNKLTARQLTNCSGYLDRELAVLSDVRVIFCLGKIAWDAVLKLLQRQQFAVPSPKPAFGHGAEFRVEPHADAVHEEKKCHGHISGLTVLGCYHVSQQNTFTGRLTEPMLDAVLERAKRAAGPG